MRLRVEAAPARRRRLGLALWTAIGMLAGCGGSADDDAEPAPDARAQAGAVADSGFVPADLKVEAKAASRGAWSRVYAWPLIGVHAVMLPDGRLLSYGTNRQGFQYGGIYDIWDAEGAPDKGHLVLPNGTGVDTFCSAQLLLPTATPQVVIAGGDIWTGSGERNVGNPNTTLFTPRDNGIRRTADMHRPRWYASMTTLVDGEVYVQGGTGGGDRPEVRELDGRYRLLGNVDTSALGAYYPRNWVAPDGRVFGFDATGTMISVDPKGTGILQRHGQFPAQYASGDGSAAMFQPGRILQFGGNSNGAIVIDLNGDAPTITPTGSMSSQRRLVTATLLPNGEVLATGGSRVWNQLVDVDNSAEIWNPRSGQWTRGAEGALARLYHSNAILLRDASVLVMGGGAEGPLRNRNVEVYYPPYLFTASGARAARPRLVSAPGVVDLGSVFRVGVASSRRIERVTLVKTGSTTHGVNMDQRFIELTFRQSGDGLVIQAPTQAVDATPGYYHLFAIDSAGVPSVSRIVRVPVPDSAALKKAPTLSDPGSQRSLMGANVRLTLRARDPTGDRLRFAAAGLPAGLALNPASGVISGEPTRAGQHDVTVTASDGLNVDTVRFRWTVKTPTEPLDVGRLVGAPAVRAGGTAQFRVATDGSNPRFRWNFGDGSATLWSDEPDAAHRYTRPGSYVVSVTITDDQGLTETRTRLQSVYLPATEHAPSASSPMLVTTPRDEAARLWVVNPDNDSVSVFDTDTRGRLAEVPTGAGPSTLALGRDGRVYVANHRGASITVIDAQSLRRVDTITLERGAAPYGLVAAPQSRHLYVVLEGTGELRRLALDSQRMDRVLDVGANARHVSVDGDGRRLYVSRFITPPLPGESTARVDVAGNVGGEVVVVDAESFRAERTIHLTPSRLADAENQGRGVPNYLGAVALSPDGTQAWVPGKQDNLQRGRLRDKRELNFQNTVRAISSRLDLQRQRHDLARRIDHDNAGVASAALFDTRGSLLFVALETSREVAVLDAFSGAQLLRIDVGRAPQGLALSPDGRTLYVHNFMDRSVGEYDLGDLLDGSRLSAPRRAVLDAVGREKLSPAVLAGKQLFYDARDSRLARDRYLSCATCHAGGGHDGRVWDLTGLGEGLRNTIDLRGRRGAQGRLHWSGNFDEVQDFEGQIRRLAGGRGLMEDIDFEWGTRSQPLGNAKAGVSADLDRLAAYVTSLREHADSPWRPSDRALSTQAAEGRLLFRKHDCASCHDGGAFTTSGRGGLTDVGTLKPSSGRRLGRTLTGIDVPTLRGAWASAPYLHDGSAPTLRSAIRAHREYRGLGSADVARLATYVVEIDDAEGPAP